MPPRAVVVARSASANNVIDKFFGQNLFNQFLLNQINPVNIISYKFAGNSTFQKVVIFLTDTNFQKVVIFSKRHNFLEQTGLNRHVSC